MLGLEAVPGLEGALDCAGTGAGTKHWLGMGTLQEFEAGRAGWLREPGDGLEHRGSHQSSLRSDDVFGVGMGWRANQGGFVAAAIGYIGVGGIADYVIGCACEGLRWFWFLLTNKVVVKQVLIQELNCIF